MKKKTWIILTLSIILALGIFWLINPKISKEITALDCEATYQMSLFGRAYEVLIITTERWTFQNVCVKNTRFLKTKNTNWK